MNRSTENGEESDSDHADEVRRVVADPRKFSEYVLQPANADGKEYIFINLLGYRPGSVEDAQQLAAMYVTQAQHRLARGSYCLGPGDQWGRRFTIEIELDGLTLRSGWVLQPDGTLWLATPFAGFTRQAR